MIFIATSNTGSGTTEVHVNSDVSNWQTRILDSTSAFAENLTGYFYLRCLGGFVRSGSCGQELIYINTGETATGTIEVNTASIENGFQDIENLPSSAPVETIGGILMLADFYGDVILDLVLISNVFSESFVVEVSVWEPRVL